MSLTHSITSQTETARQMIAQKTAEFLSSGKRINVIPSGVSGYQHDPKKFSVAKSKERCKKLANGGGK